MSKQALDEFLNLLDEFQSQVKAQADTTDIEARMESLGDELSSDEMALAVSKTTQVLSENLGQVGDKIDEIIDTVQKTTLHISTPPTITPH